MDSKRHTIVRTDLYACKRPIKIAMVRRTNLSIISVMQLKNNDRQLVFRYTLPKMLGL